MPHGEFDNTACRIVDHFPHSARENETGNDNAMPTAIGEDRIHSDKVNDSHVEDGKMAQDHVSNVASSDLPLILRRLLGAETATILMVVQDLAT